MCTQEEFVRNKPDNFFLTVQDISHSNCLFHVLRLMFNIFTWNSGMLYYLEENTQRVYVYFLYKYIYKI